MIGFVLVFALITGTVGIVYGTSISGLEHAQHVEKVNNVERAFDVMADNLKDLYRNGAPSRATEIKLAGGSLKTGDPVSIQVYAWNNSDPLDNETYQVNPEPIVYSDGRGSSLLYVDGAVLRGQSDGAVMLVEPGWVIDENRPVIPLVSTYSKGGGISGDGAVLVVAQRAGLRSLHEFRVNQGHSVLVNVTVVSPHIDAWKGFLEDRGFTVTVKDDHTLVGHIDTGAETLYIPKMEIEVSFDR